MINGWGLVPVCEVKHDQSVNNEEKYRENDWTVYFESKLFQSV